MTFFIVSGIIGVVLMAASVFLALYFRKKWEMPRKLFFRAGLVFLVIEIFHFSVLDSVLSWWPQILDLPQIWRAVIVGVSSALFFELARFFALDKLFRKVRSMREGIYFGLGWSGVSIFVIGLFMAFGAAGFMVVLSHGDVNSLLPNGTAEELEQAQMLRDLGVEMAGKDVWLAALPVLDYGVQFVLSVLLTILILLGFSKGTVQYVWAAIGMEALFITAITYASYFSVLWTGVCLLIFLAIFIKLILTLRPTF